MLTLSALIEARIAAGNATTADLARLKFWADRLGGKKLTDITPDDVDEGIAALVARGALRRYKDGMRRVGELSPSTVNRHLVTLGGLFVMARRQRLLPRGFVSPTTGAERGIEPQPDAQKFYTSDEIERLIACARVVERTGRLAVAIRVAADTGLRRGNLFDLRWADIDVVDRTATVAKTKNGTPFVAPLSGRALAALQSLPGQKFPNALVFANRLGQPYNVTHSWRKACRAANLPDKTWHALRHSFCSELARRNVTQGNIMKLANHKSLRSSQRYLHLSAGDARRIVDEVFA